MLIKIFANGFETFETDIYFVFVGTENSLCNIHAATVFNMTLLDADT